MFGECNCNQRASISESVHLNETTGNPLHNLRRYSLGEAGGKGQNLNPRTLLGLRNVHVTVTVADDQAASPIEGAAIYERYKV